MTSRSKRAEILRVKQGFGRCGLRDHHDAFISYRESAALIFLRVEPNFSAGGNSHALVNDGAPDFCVTADVDTFKQYRVFDDGEAVDTARRSDDRSLDNPAGHDGTRTHHTVQRLATPATRDALGKYKFRRRQV